MLRWVVTVDWKLLNALERLCKALPFKLKCKAGNHTLYSYLTTHIYKETIISVFLFRSAHCSFSALLKKLRVCRVPSGTVSFWRMKLSRKRLQWDFPGTWCTVGGYKLSFGSRSAGKVDVTKTGKARLEQLLYSILVLYMPLVSFISFYFLPEWLTVVMRLDLTDSLLVA